MNYKKASYTDRPLTEEERIFASDPENYDLFFKYMRVYKLDQEEWYDILILDYLRAVKKYCSVNDLQKFKFVQILFRTLDNGRSNFYRDKNRKKRMPDGGYQCIDSLDFLLENRDTGDVDTKESIIPDIRQQIEQEVLDNLTILDIMQNISIIQRQILNMFLEGYKKVEVMRYLNISQTKLTNQMESIKEVAKNYIYEIA